MFVASSLLFMSIFYGICIYGLLCDGGKERIERLLGDFSLRSIVVVHGVFLLLALFIMYWAKSNRYILYWDYAGYWGVSINRANYMIENSFGEIVKSLINSINVDDYNVFLPTLIALPFSITGYSFDNYVFLVSMMFLAPTIFVQGLMATKIVNTDKSISRYFVLGIILAFLMPANYYAVLRGYIDIAYLLPISVVIYLFIDYDFRHISVSRNIIIALLLILSWISRRYVVFFIIGFVLAMILKAVAVIIEDKCLTNIKKIVANFVIIGGVSLSFLLIFFREFFFRALLSNYSKMYSAYDTPLSSKIILLRATFGTCLFIIILIVFIMCFIHKKNRVNFISLFVMMLATTFSFWRVQDMAIHHQMMLIIPINGMFMTMFSLWRTEELIETCKLKRIWISRALILLCSLVMILNFGKAFVTKLSVNGTASFYSSRYYPLQRDDLDQIYKLVARLNELTVGTDDYIYVAASSGILNGDLLSKADMPNNMHSAVYNLLITSDVDLRDGFPTDFLNAKYVVTSSPVQLHLASGQEVVSYLANGVQDEESFIGCHYDKLDEFELDKGVIAKIYVKVSDYSEDDLEQIIDYFDGLYPDSDDLFEKRIYLQ